MMTAPLTLFTHDPDVVLMLRVQRDEPGAFAQLIDRFWCRVFGRYVRQFADRQEAEDLAQDVFLRIFRNRRRYQPRARLSTWIFHIASNVARNAIRGRARRPLRINDYDDADQREGIDPGIDAAVGLDRAELAVIVRRAVATLKGRQRRAIELQCQDHSYSEIGEELSLTAKAAKSLLYRARNELRETLRPLAESIGVSG